MKLSVQAKKPKPALSKVSKTKLTKKVTKDLPAVSSKKLALLESAKDSLPTPDKKKLDGALRKLKKSKAPGNNLATTKDGIKSPKSEKKAKKVKGIDLEQTNPLNMVLKKSVDNTPPKKSGKAMKTNKKQTKVIDLPAESKSFLQLTTGKASPNGKGVQRNKKHVNVEPLAVKSDLLSAGKAEDSVKSKKKKKSITKLNIVSVKSEEEKGAIVKNGSKALKMRKKTKQVKSEKVKQELKASATSTVPSQNELSPSVVKSVSAATLKILKNDLKARENKDLFSSQGVPVMMQIDFFKISDTPFRFIRCDVPHAIYGSDPEVCLIVPDLQRGRKRDNTYAKYVEQYEEMLQENGVTQVKQVIPFAQLRSEYSQFEMKRRLLKMFDVFLCDGRIQGHVFKFLGTIFQKARKVPTPIHAMKHDGKKWSVMPSLKEKVDSALQKVLMNIHANGDTCSLQVGHSSQNAAQLAENVQAVWKKLSLELPGGIDNIRTVYLKGPRTLAVPLYASLKSPDQVPVPKVEFERGSEEPVEDELSTMVGYRAKVWPSGEVELIDHKTKEDEQFLKDDPALLPKSKASKRSAEQGKESGKRIKIEPVTDEEQNKDLDVDEFKDVDAAEEAYLSQWSESAALKELEEQTEKEQKLKKKKNKKGKKDVKQGEKLSKKTGVSFKLSGGSVKKAKKSKLGKMEKSIKKDKVSKKLEKKNLTSQKSKL